MATYKVLQDIESEDKLLGPFTLKQFIFLFVDVGLALLMFRILVTNMPLFIKLPFIALILPLFLVLGFLAAPLGRDQPNDIWLFAQLRFFFKPRRRIWDQDGASNLVTVTAPKKDDHVYSNNFSQAEVKSRLGALANTLDSRGWAIKNINANLFSQPGYLTDSGGSDRLVAAMDLPQEVSSIDVLASDDILDPTNNVTAQHLDQLVQQSAAAIKQQAANAIATPAIPTPPAQTPQNYWFMDQNGQAPASLPQDYTVFGSQQVIAPGVDDTIPDAEATAEEKALAHKIASEQEAAKAHVVDHMKVLNPLHDHDGNIIQQPAAEIEAVGLASRSLQRPIRSGHKAGTA